MNRVVLDTNTLISGFLWDGNEARIMEKAENKEIQLFISQEILEELEGVLKRKKFIKMLEGKEYTVEKAVTKIALMSIIIESTISINVIKEDPDDDRVLECAVSANADLIISGDSHLLNLVKYEGIEIISSGSFIKA